MKWHYRTILFEFQKDGLLGDRYIDDDEMENILNEYGEKGWELVSVTPVQEGLLSFLKRPRQQAGSRVAVTRERPIARAAKSATVSSSKTQAKPGAAEQSKNSPSQKTDEKPDEIGGIKIS